MNWLDNEIDKWWCSQFTTYKMKRVSGHKFVPEPAYIDENFKQTEDGNTKIAFGLDLDWQVDLNEMELEADDIRELAKYFYDLGKNS